MEIATIYMVLPMSCCKLTVCFFFIIISRGNQCPLPPPLALDVEVLDKKIGLRLKGAI